MKKITLLLLIFAFYTTAKASHCAEWTFQKEHINLFLCQNASTINGRNRERALLFRAKTIALNELIKNKIENGQLENKRFEIQIWCSMLSPRRLELTQGRNGYFATMSFEEFPSMEKLIIIVNSFANPDWQPLISFFNHRRHGETEEESYRRWNADIRRIDNFFAQNAITEPVEFSPVTVWEHDGIALELTSDGLRYAIDGERLSFLADIWHSPVRIGNRFLFFQQDWRYTVRIHVVENREVIQVLETSTEPLTVDELEVEVGSKWVNIGSWRGWVYSYSYEENRFFRVRGD